MSEWCGEAVLAVLHEAASQLQRALTAFGTDAVRTQHDLSTVTEAVADRIMAFSAPNRT